MVRYFTYVFICLLSLVCFSCKQVNNNLNLTQSTETVDSCNVWMSSYVDLFNKHYYKDSLSDTVVISIFKTAISDNNNMQCADSSKIRCNLNNFIAYISMRQKDFLTASQYFTTALIYAKQLPDNDKNRSLLASCYANLLRSYWHIGDTRSILLYGWNAIDMFKLSNDSTNLSKSMTWYADALAVVDSVDLAARYFAESQQYDPNNVENCLQAAKFYNHLADKTTTMTASSVENEIKKFTDIAQKIVVDSIDKAELYYTLGCISWRKKQTILAMQYFNRAAVFATALPITNEDRIKIDLTKANSYYEEKKLEIAMSLYNNAINAFVPSLKAENLKLVNNINLLPVSLWLLDALIRKLKVLQAMGKADTSDYNEAITYLQYIGLHYKDENSVYDLLDESHYLYELSIDNALQYGDTEKAFQYAEQSKAFVYRNFLNHRKNLFFTGVPDSLQQQERELMLTISALQGQLYDENRQIVDSIAKKMLITKTKQLSLQQLFEKKFPKYYDLKYQIFKPRIDSVSSHLEANQALVSYFLGKNNLYIFLVQPKCSQVYKKSINVQFTENLSYFLETIQQNTDLVSNFFESHELYDFLLADLLKDIDTSVIKRLIIVPDGALCLLPFDALVSQYSKNYEQLGYQSNKIPYFLKKMAVSYQYTVNDVLQEPYAWKNCEVGGLGNNYLGSNNRLYNAVKEVLMAVEIMGGEKCLNENATYKNMKKMANECDILHLAMHGSVNKYDPLRSYLLFVDDYNKNDTLFVKNLYQESIDVGLVMFNTCESGAGSVEHHEGVISLARAFAFAGCKSLVLSYWTLDDNVSLFISNCFYKEIKENVTKDIALQQAKLMYLKQPFAEKRKPFYWASINIIGDTNSIPEADQFYWFRWAVLGFFILSFVLWHRFRKTKQILS